MKLLFRGGLNKYESDGYLRSYFHEYSSTISKLIDEEQNVGFVTIAKPDGYYDDHILSRFGSKVDIIDRSYKVQNWRKYDLLILCGGDTVVLKKGLINNNFDIYDLRDEVVVLGDSAGAMIMAPWLYDTKERISVDFHEGIYPDTNVIVIPHYNNPRYCSSELEGAVKEFAVQKKLEVLCLDENETVLYDHNSGDFIDFVFSELF